MTDSADSSTLSGFKANCMKQKIVCSDATYFSEVRCAPDGLNYQCKETYTGLSWALVFAGVVIGIVIITAFIINQR